MYIQKIQKGWKELNEEIIETGKCVYCGACGAFCANIRFDIDKERPFEDGSCKDANTCRDGYGLCYNICPKTETNQIPLQLLDKWVFGKQQDKILGHYIEIVSARVSEAARKELPIEAGVITALSWVAMDVGMIDAAIITSKDDKFRPQPFLAKSKEELTKGIGYKPSQSPTLSLVGEAINKGFVDIGVVGTPCQVQALRKLQNHPRFDFEAYDLVTLAIGTFCFGTFHNQGLMELFKENGVISENIKKIEKDNDRFKMIIHHDSEKKNISLKELYDKAIRTACFSCSDYTASFADLSIGEVGSNSKEGWRTVIIRTEKGKKLMEAAVDKGIIEIAPLEKDEEELVLELTRNKTDLSIIEDIIEHSAEIKSFVIRNPRIASAYKPGQFVILWIPDVDFLPMSVSAVNGSLIEITVQKIGEGTSRLFELKKGDKIGIRGPFGNAWNYEDATNILIVGGGMGIAALTSLIEPLKQNKKNVYVAIGAKDEASLIFADRLIEHIPNTLCTTDDGSVGKKCLVTDALDDILNQHPIDLIITCGPEVMMKKVLEIATEKGIELQASLERKMKCGVGTCGSCCIGPNNDACVCKEGPIFTGTFLKDYPLFGTYSKG
ncbi:MAG: dihydroorotate dehydrogenase electron transfer subunit [Promethearchaeota archaeon]